MTVTCVAAMRLRTDSKTDVCFVTPDQETLEHLVGGPALVIQTDLRTAFVTATGATQDLNEHAMQLARLYGVDQPLFGDVLIFGCEGQELLDAPGVALGLHPSE